MDRQASVLGYDEKEFQKFESKIDEVVNILTNMNNCEKSNSKEEMKNVIE